MMKKLFLATAALTLAVGASAQSRSPKAIDRSEISVSYGALPATGWVDNFGKAIIGSFVGMESSGTDWGAITVGYNFRFSTKVSIGAQVVYASGEDTYKLMNVTETVDNTFWSLMPNVKVNWLGSRIVSLYTRVGAGVTFQKSSVDGESGSETRFAFQFSPIGIEIGGSLAGYAEAGLGMSGSILVGARYRF